MTDTQLNPNSAPQNAVPTMESTPLEGKRVVIVEDEGITQLQLRKILQQMGLRVVGCALNGREGVEICLRECPQLVLMDINMPGEINGLEAARRILKEYRTCIVILTAYNDFRQEACELGACGYITKPIESSSLLPQLTKAFSNYYPHERCRL